MAHTDAASGVQLHDVGDPLGALATYVNYSALSIATILAARKTQFFSFANVTARNAETTMVNGSFGYQVDVDTTFRYNTATASWKYWDKPWATFTPTYTGITSTSPTNSGSYMISNGQVFVRFDYTLGTSPTVGNATLNLPVTMDITGMVMDSTIIDSAVVYDGLTANTYFTSNLRVASASTVRFLRPLQPATYTTNLVGGYAVLTASVPLSWASGNRISGAFNYPAA